MITFSRNSLKYQNVRTPPEHTANGNVHTDILLLGIIALEYMSFKTIFGGFNGAFWWFGVLSEDQEFFFVESTETILWL